MAYTIVKTNGTVLTTIADGTINTTSTPIGLPGRNYAGYGQQLDTNFVHTLENFAAPTPPANPLTGQLWYNTNTQQLAVCPADGTSNASAWLVLTTTASTGTTTFGALNVTGNVSANNVAIGNTVTANAATFSYLTVTANTSLANLTVANANVTGTLTTNNITTGSNTAAGNITGVWTVTGSAGGNNAVAMNFALGGIAISNSAGANLYGIMCDKYMYANGVAINFGGSYSNSNVGAYLPSANVNILSSQVTTTVLTAGANTTMAALTGTWSLTTGSSFAASTAGTVTVASQPNITSVGTLSSLSLSGNINASNNYIVSSSLKAYSEYIVSNSSATGTITVDLSASNFFNYTLTGNVTFSFINAPSSTMTSFTMAVTQDATGGRVITWPTGTKWAGGVAPPETTTAGATDIWTFMTYNGGTNWIGSLSVKAAA